MQNIKFSDYLFMSVFLLSTHVKAAKNSCPDIFDANLRVISKPKAKPKAKAKVKVKSVPSRESKGLLLTINPHNTIQISSLDNRVKSNEEVILKNGHKQFPPTPEIAIEKPQTDIYESNAINLVSVWVPRGKNSQLAIGHEGTGIGKDPDQNKISNDDLVKMFSLEMNQNGGRGPSKSQIDERVALSKSRPDIVETARAHFLQKHQSESDFALASIHLANFGDIQYIKFIPVESEVEVHARILDIGLKNEESALILVEWINPALHDKLGAKRVRHIGYLEPSELSYLRELPSNEVHEVQTTFMESLTLSELQTLKSAEHYGINLVNFQPHTRLEAELGIRLSEIGPLTLMNEIVHLGIFNMIAKRWSEFSIHELYTEEEKETYIDPNGHKQFIGGNVLDIITRHTPRYILSKFNDQNSDFKYAFVITQDGQLKLTPFSPRSASFYAPLLRIAHGRRIFVGGTFILSPKGDVEVSFESMHYGNANGGDGNSAYGGTKNPKLHSFISEAFKVQTGRTVTYIDHRAVGPESHYYAHYDQGKVDESFRNGGFKDEQNSVDTFKQIKWNSEDPNIRPLDYESYVEATDGVFGEVKDDSGNVIKSRKWAHYILNTTEDTSVANIRSSYRALVSKFHPDKNPNIRGAKETIKHINSAKDVLLK